MAKKPSAIALLALVTLGILALQKLNEVLFKCHCETGDCLQEPLGEVEAITRIHVVA